MANTIAPLLPATRELLVHLGERLRLARLRRKLTATQVAARAGMSRMTLRAIENGSAGATIGAYLAVMQVLGLEQDVASVADTDDFGRHLQDAALSSTAKSPAAKPQTTERPDPAKATSRPRIQPTLKPANPPLPPTPTSSKPKTQKPTSDTGNLAADLASLLQQRKQKQSQKKPQKRPPKGRDPARKKQ